MKSIRGERTEVSELFIKKNKVISLVDFLR